MRQATSIEQRNKNNIGSIMRGINPFVGVQIGKGGYSKLVDRIKMHSGIPARSFMASQIGKQWRGASIEF